MNKFARITVIRNLAAAALILLILCGTLPSRATLVLPMKLDEVVAQADKVFEGTVLWTKPELDKESGDIWTSVAFRVDDSLKGGDSKDKIIIRKFIGGTVGGITLIVDHLPDFKTGQRGLFMLEAKDSYYSPIVGFNQGIFRFSKDRKGKEFVSDHHHHPVSEVVKTSGILKSFAGPLTPSALKSEVKSIIAAQTPAAKGTGR